MLPEACYLLRSRSWTPGGCSFVVVDWAPGEAGQHRLLPGGCGQLVTDPCMNVQRSCGLVCSLAWLRTVGACGSIEFDSNPSLAGPHPAPTSPRCLWRAWPPRSACARRTPAPWTAAPPAPACRWANTRPWCLAARSALRTASRQVARGFWSLWLVGSAAPVMLAACGMMCFEMAWPAVVLLASYYCYILH